MKKWLVDFILALIALSEFFVLSFSIISDIDLLCYLLWTIFLYFIGFLSHPFIRVALFKVSLYTYFTVRFMLTDFEWFNAILLF